LSWCKYLRSTLFPYTTLFRSGVLISYLLRVNEIGAYKSYIYSISICLFSAIFIYSTQLLRDVLVMFFYLLGIYYTFNRKNTFLGDRKSTRLNSSHVKISYAVF